MTPTSAPTRQASAVDDPRVVQATEEYAELLRNGARPDRAAFLARHAAIADALAACLDGLEFVHAVGGDISGAAGRMNGDGTDFLRSEVPLGDYQLIRELGRGGMGIVYEAEQLSLGRRVALKVLPLASTMDAKQLQRFKNEARAAASLHHEHIVPVYGVGCERGVHFYAMQLIEGKSLAVLIRQLQGEPDSSGGGQTQSPAGRSCHRFDRAQASVESKSPSVPGDVTASYPGTTPPQTEEVAALETQASRKDRAHYRSIAEMMAQAADALEHAHSLGIVHRDVKPGNLLLDNAGHLWVTDFGLARFGSDADLTMTGDLLGTLRYMSPEQALAKHGLVDHRTDVYSLGATLYELLTLLPAMGGADKQEILKRIAFEEPRAPRSLDRTIPEELETITLKALAKEPGERYATAGDLASDLRRWLSHLTIKARPPGVRQRVAKWARRHPGVTATAGISAVLLLGLVIAGLGVNNALLEQERQRTRAAAELAFQSAREMLSEIAKAIEDSPGLEQTQRSAAQSAVMIFERLADYREATPEDRGLAQFHLGVINDRLGDLKKGREAYQQAADIFGRLADQEPNNAEYRYWQAHSLAENGELCDRLGNGKDAEDLARRAFELFQQAEKKFPDNALIRAGLADCCLVLGSVNFVPGPRMNMVYLPDYAPRRWQECVKLLRRALELYPTVIEGQPDQRDLRWRYHRTQKILSQMPNLSIAERERLSNESVAGFRALTKAFPQKHRPRTELCEALGWRGSLFEIAGQPAESMAEHRNALAIADRLCDEYPSVPYYRTLQASARLWLGLMLVSTDQLEEGQRLLNGAAETLQAIPEGHVPTWQLWNHGWNCYRYLAFAYAQEGRLDEAEEAFRKVWELAQRQARDHQNSAVWVIPNLSANWLASLLIQRRSTDAAIAILREHADFWAQLAALQPANVLVLRAHGISLNNFGVVLQSLGRWDQSDQVYQESLNAHNQCDTIRRLNPKSEAEWYGIQRFGWRWTQKNCGWLYAQAGRSGDAEKANYEIVKRARSDLAPGPDGMPAQRKDVANVMQQHGSFLNTIGRRYESIVAYEKAMRQLDQWSVTFPNEPHAGDAADCRMELAFVYQRVGNAADANRVADEAVNVRRKLASSNKAWPRRRLAERLKDQGRIRWHAGRIEEAASARAEAVEIMEGLVSDPGLTGAARLQFEDTLALVTTGHAQLLDHTGKSLKAEAAYVRSVALRRRLAEAVIPGEWFGRDQLGPMNGYVSARRDWARSLTELAGFRLRRGEAERAAEHCSEARTVLEDMVAAYPGDPAALNQLARFLVACPVETLRDPARAIRLAEKAIVRDETSDYVSTLGAAQYRAGDFRAAIATLDHATRLRFQPPAAEDLFFRAMARWRLGETEAARSDYEETLRSLEPFVGPGSDPHARREEAAALLGVK